MMMDLAGLVEHLRRVTVEVSDAGKSFGSGVLWPRGCVVTNAHVARRARVAVRLIDGRCLEGRLIARDADVDLALLRVPGTGIPTATVADVDTTRVGFVGGCHRASAWCPRRADGGHHPRRGSDHARWAPLDSG